MHASSRIAAALRAVALMLCYIATASAQTPMLAGIYSVSETVTITATLGGQTDTETQSGSVSGVVFTQNGNMLSYSYSQPPFGNVGRTMTLNGTSIVAITGPGAFIQTQPGVVVSQNVVISVSGSAQPGRIEVRLTGRITGTASGSPFTATVSSVAVFTNAATAPTITSQPQSRSVATGAQAVFAVTASGASPLTYQWRRNGIDIGGATSASLTITNSQAADAGSYTVVVSNALGSTTSAAASLTVTPALTAPVIASQPRDVSARAGATVAITVGATGSAPLTYQWRKNGVSLAGATGPTLVLNGASASDAATYSVSVSNAIGTTISNPAFVFVADARAALAPSRLSNLSVRSATGTGAQTLIVGFVVGGGGTAGTKQMLVRGVGPALTAFGVSGALEDPRLTLYNGTSILAANDDWNGDPQLTEVGARVGAFAIASPTSRDAALYRASQAAGAFSAQITGGGPGIALAEIYDATPPAEFTSGTPRLVNVSARTQVGVGGDILIVGFVVGGPTAQAVLVRGIGPTLSGFGVPGALADPKLELFQGTTKIGENDDWGGAAAIAAAATRVGAFALGALSRDAVILISLAPGAYTAQVSGVGGTTGIGLIELYEVP